MKISAICFFIFISIFGFSQTPEKKILFQGDSIWFSAQNQFLLSSIDKGKSWDTIFPRKDRIGNVFYTLESDTSPNGFVQKYHRELVVSDTVFFNGELDTATNVFISDQRTIVVFGWDGTMHYKTFLYATSDCGKTWNKSSIQAQSGVVGVKYLHKISPTRFFLDRRFGNYAVTFNAGKTWYSDKLIYDKYCNQEGARDERFSIAENGDISYGYYSEKDCMVKKVMISHDGLTFTKLK